MVSMKSVIARTCTFVSVLLLVIQDCSSFILVLTSRLLYYFNDRQQFIIFYNKIYFSMIYFINILQ